MLSLLAIILSASVPFSLAWWDCHPPSSSGSSSTTPTPCLTDSYATFLVDIMVSFSVGFDPDYAGQFLADDFTVQSDSINIVIGSAPGALTAPSKQAFLAASYNLTTSAPQPNITVLDVMHSCREIAFRWRSESVPVTVQGIDVLVTEDGLIHADYSEFDNVADLVNAGLWPCRG